MQGEVDVQKNMLATLRAKLDNVKTMGKDLQKVALNTKTEQSKCKLAVDHIAGVIARTSDQHFDIVMPVAEKIFTEGSRMLSIGSRIESAAAYDGGENSELVLASQKLCDIVESQAVKDSHELDNNYHKVEAL